MRRLLKGGRIESNRSCPEQGIYFAVLGTKNMADISLTASMRSNLLSLQNTQKLMDMTQERLSTGKKVNSAIDNPSSYYTAQSLNNRANDLSSLLDSMGQGIQTLKAADEAIKTITSFAEQAKAIASSARDVPSFYDKYAITSEEVSEPVSGSFIVDARDNLSKFTLDVKLADQQAGAKFTIYNSDGGTSLVDLSELTGTPDQDSVTAFVVNKLQGLGLNAKAETAADGSFTGKIEVSSTDGTAISWVNDATTGIADDSSAARLVALDKDSTGANSATIAAEISRVAKDPADNGLIAEPYAKTFSITATGKEFRVFAVPGDLESEKVLETLGIEGSRKAGDAKEISAERVSYAKQFNDILEQIDALANDAGYKGVNLLQENNLKVIFNESRSSLIEIQGVDASSKGLGISQAQDNWQKDSNIEYSIGNIEKAISKLRTIASEFGNNYSVVQSRENFTDNVINVLTEGADKLILADMNEESANMLALQTRQQLAVNSLSMASQAAQAVLKLF